VTTWLGCIDAVLSTLSIVHKSSHTKHQALAWNLCLSHLKAHRESLVQACRLSPNYSSKVHSFEASLLYHVNELILEVIKVSQDTTTQSKVEAHSLEINTLGLEDLLGMDAVQDLFRRYDYDNSGTINNTKELQLLIVNIMYACEERSAKWKTDKSAQRSVPALLKMMRSTVRAVSFTGIPVSDEHQWTLEDFVNYFDKTILERNPLLSLVTHSNPLNERNLEQDINSIMMEIDQALDSQHFAGQDELHTEDTATTVAEDSGSGVQQDSGSRVQQDNGSGVQQDSGSGVQQDSGPSASETQQVPFIAAVRV